MMSAFVKRESRRGVMRIEPVPDGWVVHDYIEWRFIQRDRWLVAYDALDGVTRVGGISRAGYPHAPTRTRWAAPFQPNDQES